jgi:integrase
MGGKQKECGLGSLKAVSLADARTAAADCRKLLADGKDPIAERREQRRDVPTFGAAADALIASLAPSFKSPVHQAQWETTLGKVAYDSKKVRIDRAAHDAHVKALKALRDKRVDVIDTADVLSVLRPIWFEAPETASRLRGRIERVLDAARVEGHRSGENPARWRGHLSALLTRPDKRNRTHHAALPFDEVPAFVARLRNTGGISARALEFAILTAARTGEVLGAVWQEFDLEGKLWTVPATRMKAGREHRVPLSDRAMAILAEMAAFGREPDAHVFPGQKRSKPLSGMALEMAVRRLGAAATPHGFRSSFRDWAGEVTHFPREVAEAALAHVVGDATERAYRRGDALAKRRELMDAWGRWCEPKASNIVALSARRS